MLAAAIAAPSAFMTVIHPRPVRKYSPLHMRHSVFYHQFDRMNIEKTTPIYTYLFKIMMQYLVVLDGLIHPEYHVVNQLKCWIFQCIHLNQHLALLKTNKKWKWCLFRGSTTHPMVCLLIWNCFGWEVVSKTLSGRAVCITNTVVCIEHTWWHSKRWPDVMSTPAVRLWRAVDNRIYSVTRHYRS